MRVAGLKQDINIHLHPPMYQTYLISYTSPLNTNFVSLYSDYSSMYLHILKLTYNFGTVRIEHVCSHGDVKANSTPHMS